MPARYPPYQTCHRRFQTWTAAGVMEAVLHALARDLHERGGLDLSECFVDATFASAKKGAQASGRRDAAKAARSWQSRINLLDGGRFWSSCLRMHSKCLTPSSNAGGTSPGYSFYRGLPVRLIGDKAYDSDPRDAQMKAQGVAVIDPHKSNRTKPKTQDGRVLRRYRRRWKIERLFAWLHDFRRLVTRWERKAQNFLAFVQLGCIVILLTQFRHL